MTICVFKLPFFLNGMRVSCFRPQVIYLASLCKTTQCSAGYWFHVVPTANANGNVEGVGYWQLVSWLHVGISWNLPILLQQPTLDNTVEKKPGPKANQTKLIGDNKYIRKIWTAPIGNMQHQHVSRYTQRTTRHITVPSVLFPSVTGLQWFEGNQWQSEYIQQTKTSHTQYYGKGVMHGCIHRSICPILSFCPVLKDLSLIIVSIRLCSNK